MYCDEGYKRAWRDELRRDGKRTDVLMLVPIAVIVDRVLAAYAEQRYF